MKPVSQQNFGIIIAYILPGFIALGGVSAFSLTARRWLGASPAESSSVSGFLFVTIASLGLGIFVNTLRRIIIDPIHHNTGINKSNWDYRLLQENLAAVEFLVEHQFKFYQFHANTFVALAFTFATNVPSGHFDILLVTSVFFVLEIILWFGSRDNLRNYFRRLEDILGNHPAVLRQEPDGKTQDNNSAIDRSNDKP